MGEDDMKRFAHELPKMPTAPPSKIAESPLFKELRESVAKESTAFTFACGGTILIMSSSNELTSAMAKPTQPLESGTQDRLDQLIQDMGPATFGRGGEDVLDESYRKAAKMDPSQFSSTFNPYELGIVDAVAQALLPSLRHSKQTRAVRAELYKLNMYSGPSGKFKSHVDTPRSESQFGSLVVCLPLRFEGGALEVRHKGKAVTFDWSTTGNGSDGGHPSICWAASYSDCEHEIFEVTEGHRLTLTYNLYSVRGNGQLGGNYPWLDPTQLPLYKIIRDLVQDKEGWMKGGFIGYNCSHVYPHSTHSKLNFLAPDNLKGADMLIYEIFRSLGFKVSFRPVVKDTKYRRHKEGHLLPISGLSLRWKRWDMMDQYLVQGYDEWTGRAERKDAEHYSDSDEDEQQETESYVDFGAVHWLNDYGHNEPQIAWVAYGNESWTAVTYSCVAMTVEIPSSDSQRVEE